jgi:hypothetical protein
MKFLKLTSNPQTPMKKNRILIGLVGLATSLVLVSSCKDDDDDKVTPTPTPTPDATITFATPTEGQVYHLGDTIKINGNLTTKAAFHGYRIAIRNHEDQTEYSYKSGSGHGTNFNFEHSWVNTLTDSTELDIEIVALLDHETGAVAGKRLEVQTAP